MLAVNVKDTGSHFAAMVTTRGQQKAEASGEPAKTLSPAKQRIVSKKDEEHGEAQQQTNKHGVKPEDKSEHHGKAAELPQKAPNQASRASDNSILDCLLTTYGSFPLESTTLAQPDSPTPSTVLAHLFNALLSSTRISHAIASKTLHLVIEAGYADLETLEKSTWEERTEVLTDGGYTHYREKMATELGEAAEWVRRECEGDLNTILHDTEQKGEGAEIREKARKKIKEVKGFGELAADVFCNTVQGVWGELAPFLDPRSQKTAVRIGLPGSAEELFGMVGRNPVEMARLASALTVVRLERKELEFCHDCRRP